VFLTQNGGAELTHQDIEDLGHAPPNHLTRLRHRRVQLRGPALHRHCSSGTASNLDSPDGFRRTAPRHAVNAYSVITR
jgi:hypothetical protein